MYRKRLIALAAALLLMTVGVVVYFIVHGSTYTEDLEWMDDPKMTEDDLSVEVDNENIVRADRVYLNEDRKFCVDFHSVGGGTTAVTYFVKDRFTYKTELFVNEFGTIIAKDSLNFDGYVQVEILMIVGLALILLVMLSCFIESWIKARFSYSMVGYGGVALFSASVITVVIYGMQWMNTFARFLNNIMETGFLFAFVSAPVMLIISLAISLSNIRLISREGFSIRNMLGVLLGVGWIVGLFLVILSSNMMLDFSESVMARISYSIAYVISFMACMLLSTIACAFLAAKHRPPYDRDYILILGCSICPDGSLTPILKNRADAAIRFEKEQFSASGRHAKFVPSGGKGDDEIISEGEAMARYLREQGYPDSQIIIEDKSVNTSQNIEFSRDKIKEDAGTLENVRSAFATTNYHIFRGYILSKKHGFDAQGVYAKTKWYFFPNAFLREFAGLLVEKRYKIALIVLATLLLFHVSAQLFSMYTSPF